MSRLASQAAAGFFATPSRVVAAVSRLLVPAGRGSRQVIRVLDPCAGTGEPCATIAAALRAESYGIELQADRAEQCRQRLGRLLATSAFSVRLANGAFSVLWLNPPYDADDEKKRLEHRFLTALARALCPGGVLVYIIPQRRLGVSARYLAAHFTDLRAYRFPDPEFAAFSQIVLLGVKRSRAAPDGTTQARLESWSETDLTPLPDVPEGTPIVVPALSASDILFAPLSFDPRLAAEEARRRGVWQQAAFAEQLWPSVELPVRPLMPLRRGHLALLVAAGLLNNVALEQNGERVLVKGRAHKELVEVEGEPDTDVQCEVLRTSVVVLHLGDGRLERVDQGGETERKAA